MSTPSARAKVVRYYVRHSVVPFEEDVHHEFKGHRDLAVDEMPRGACRHAVSRTLDSFLNTGGGATVYLGVTDNGTVHGLKMTRLQRDHVIDNLQDLFSRYTPPVLPHR
jgi:hypothetical protein